MRTISTLSVALILISGCASSQHPTPSQNPSLNAVSPNTAGASKGGYIQRNLDQWIKEEWTPMTDVSPSTPVPSASTEQPLSSPSVSTESAPPVPNVQTTSPKVEDTTPFTLQKYADKWKVYLENKEKMKAGKVQEPSHLQQMESLPVIGK